MCAIVQTHLNQVENDYKERLERELSARNQFEKVKMFLSPSPQSVRHNCFNDIQFFFFLAWYDYRRLQIWKQNLRSAKQKLKLAGKQMSWVFSHSIVLVRKCMFLFIFLKCIFIIALIALLVVYCCGVQKLITEISEWFTEVYTCSAVWTFSIILIHSLELD